MSPSAAWSRSLTSSSTAHSAAWRPPRLQARPHTGSRHRGQGKGEVSSLQHWTHWARAQGGGPAHHQPLHHTRPRVRIVTESRGCGGEDELPCAGQQLTLQPRRAEHAAHPAECPGRPPAPGPPPPRWPRCSTSPRSPCYQLSTVLTTLSQLTARTPGPGPTPPPAPVRGRGEQY